MHEPVNESFSQLRDGLQRLPAARTKQLAQALKAEGREETAELLLRMQKGEELSVEAQEALLSQLEQHSDGVISELRRHNAVPERASYDPHREKGRRVPRKPDLDQIDKEGFDWNPWSGRKR